LFRTNPKIVSLPQFAAARRQTSPRTISQAITGGGFASTFVMLMLCSGFASQRTRVKTRS
jgi:hypothetical protein